MTNGVGARLLAIGLVFCGLAAAPIPQAAGPIGYWKLDETAGPTAADAMGLGGDGTWNGTVGTSTDVPPPITAAGAFPDCGSITLAPSATANYVSLGRTAALDTVQDGSFTLSAWFKPASIPTADPDAQYGIVLKTGLHEGIALAGNSFVMSHWVGSGPTNVSAGYGANTCPNVDTWYHVCGVVDLSMGTNGQVRVYINGNPPPFSATGDIPAAMSAWTGYQTEPWLIGINSPAGGTYRYQADGKIDDVRIYNRALTTTEITTLANGGTVGDPVVAPPATPANLVATPGINQVSLTWDPVPGATSYNVKRRTAATTLATIAMPTTNSYVDAPVTGGTTYYYAVSAVIGCSEGSNTVEVAVVPLSSVPRTKKVGKDADPCGCGSAAPHPGVACLAAAVAMLLVLGARRRA